MSITFPIPVPTHPIYEGESKAHLIGHRMSYYLCGIVQKKCGIFLSLIRGEYIFYADEYYILLSLKMGEYLFYADRHSNFISLNGELIFEPMGKNYTIRAKYLEVHIMEP